jgi:hypothetical protein
MNPIAVAILSRIPWFKLAKWLLAELGWQRDVAQWLAAENEWYFRLAAVVWGGLASDLPVAEMKSNLVVDAHEVQ